MPSPSTKRCFITLPLSRIIIADLTDYTAQLDIPLMRPAPPDKLHLTLKFLGDVPNPQIPTLIDTIRQTAAAARPMPLHVTQTVFFPNPRRPRVWAATLNCPDPLTALFYDLDHAMHRLGFRKESRRFHPHITLGRFPPRSRRGEWGSKTAISDPPATGFLANRLSLMQSQLNPSGAVHTPLAEFPLTEPDQA